MTDTILVIPEKEVVILQLPDQGPAGPMGPPGVSGGDTGRVTQVWIAGEPLGGHRVVYANEGSAFYASADNADTAMQIAGITTHAAAMGGDIQVQSAGPLTEPSWDWDVTKPIFLGLNGLMTQTVNMAWNFIRIVGYPTGLHSMMVSLEEPVFL